MNELRKAERRAWRAMGIIVWLAIVFTAALCLWAGLFIGMRVFGGG